MTSRTFSIVASMSGLSKISGCRTGQVGTAIFRLSSFQSHSSLSTRASSAELHYQHSSPLYHSCPKDKNSLLKRPWNLTRGDRQKLADIQANNQRLYRAYLLKETLADALDQRTLAAAGDALDDWLSWASRSRLEPFKRVARTIRKYRDGVLAYIESKLTNGLVEGINNKLRTIARRAYGFHSASPLIAMLFLCSGGIQLNPPLPGPLPT